MLSVARIVVAGIGVLLCAVPAFAQSAGAQKAIVVTGASSGIGRKVTERLAANGFFVYAGARAQKDLDELSAIKNVQGVRLDVTSAADIRRRRDVGGQSGARIVRCGQQRRRRSSSRR
jgi:nucleoside-diphosphate-sugar epimerase